MQEGKLYYERAGIVIIYDGEQFTFKKNGLTIEIPVGILEECGDEWAAQVDAENISLLNQIRNHKQ